MVAVCHLGFLKVRIFNDRYGGEASMRHLAFAAIGQTVVKIWRFIFLQYGASTPSWICCVGDWTIHEERLVVFITVQNLVGIDAVVSIICKF